MAAEQTHSGTPQPRASRGRHVVSLPYRPLRRAARSRLLHAFTLIAILACDENLPTAPAPAKEEQSPAVPITPLEGGSGLLTARARALPRGAATLLSTEIEHAKGRYRYRQVEGGAALPALKRDD